MPVKHSVLKLLNIVGTFDKDVISISLKSTCLVMLPSAAMELLGRWPLGRALCEVHTSLDITMCTVSILHLLLISHDR